MSAPPNASRQRNAGLAILATGVCIGAALIGLSWIGEGLGDAPDDTASSVLPQESSTPQDDAKTGSSATPGGGAAGDPRDEVKGSSPPPSQEPSNGQPGSTIQADPPTEDVVAASLADLFEEESEVLRSPNTSKLDPIAFTGPYEAALTNKLIEFEAGGLRQVGFADVTSIELREERLDETPPRVAVYACVDNSGVDVIDERGNSLLNEGNPSTSAQIFTLIWEEGRWVIHEATFPEDPRC